MTQVLLVRFRTKIFDSPGACSGTVSFNPFWFTLPVSRQYPIKNGHTQGVTVLTQNQDLLANRST